MDVHPAVATGVLDVSQAAEAVHEEADAGTSGPNHLRKGFLRDAGYEAFTSAFELGQRQESASKPFFTRIEEMVNQVCLHQSTAGQKKRMKEMGERLVRFQCLL